MNCISDPIKRSNVSLFLQVTAVAGFVLSVIFHEFNPHTLIAVASSFFVFCMGRALLLEQPSKAIVTKKQEEYEKGLQECLNTCKKVNKVATKTILLVNVEKQELYLIQNHVCVQTYPISTAEKGLGQEKGSYQTPAGLHEIATKIGDGFSKDTCFDSREPIFVENPMESEKPLIMGRILWLKGLEPGFNQGTNQSGATVDSNERYIYLHGTNKEKELGTRASAGCVRLSVQNIIDLFKRVNTSDIVYIY